jgi:predicted nuclease with TOPRIM domain
MGRRQNHYYMTLYRMIIMSMENISHVSMIDETEETFDKDGNYIRDFFYMRFELEYEGCISVKIHGKTAKDREETIATIHVARIETEFFDEQEFAEALTCLFEYNDMKRIKYLLKKHRS